MSLTYNKNKSGTDIDPWGTPQVRFPGSENCLSILTLKVLPDKYDSDHVITFSENPMDPIFLMGCIGFLEKVITWFQSYLSGGTFN